MPFPSLQSPGLVFWGTSALSRSDLPGHPSDGLDSVDLLLSAGRVLLITHVQ